MSSPARQINVPSSSGARGEAAQAAEPLAFIPLPTSTPLVAAQDATNGALPTPAAPPPPPKGPGSPAVNGSQVGNGRGVANVAGVANGGSVVASNRGSVASRENVTNGGSVASLEAISTAGHATLRAEVEGILAAHGAGGHLDELLRLTAADHASVRSRLRELGIDKLGEKLRVQAALRRLLSEGS